MAERNKHGLSRHIPADIEREVRQRCGFGCVICGVALYDHEHFAPDFKDAVKHDPAGITLLCMQCNQKRRRGVLSVETVQAANANPKCLAQGFASETFDFGTSLMEVKLAGATFRNIKTLVTIKGYPILSIRSPEASGQPYRLSGLFVDDIGNYTLKITDNVWSADVDQWDVECEGARITIRNRPRNICLVLKQEPPTRLIVERLNMYFEGVWLRGNADRLQYSHDGVGWSTIEGVIMQNGSHGIAF